MPSSDLILNVKQIAGYPPAGVSPLDTLLLQRGGLGGPYYQVSVQTLVGDGLAGGGPFQVGLAAPGDAIASQAFTGGLAFDIDGPVYWNAYDAAGGVSKFLTAGPAGMMRADASQGFQFFWGPGGAAGAPVAFTPILNVTPGGYLSVNDQILVARDPVAALEVATSQWVSAQIASAVAAFYGAYNNNTVWSFNNRVGSVILGLNDVMGAGGAPIFSPSFSGVPTAPTPVPADSSNALATTQWVWQAIAYNSQSGVVSSFNGRAGAVVLTAADVQTAGSTVFAALASPNFSGVPTAPTPAAATSTGQLATTAFVHNAITAATAGVASFNTRTGAVVLTAADVTGVGGALLAGPAFTGAPQAPTAAPGTSTLQIATTAFVGAAIAAGGYAPLASPVFTGVPAGPTATAGTSTTQLATTAFVQAAVAAATAGVSSFNGRTGAVTLIANDVSGAGGAVLASPAFTGTPTAPTAATADNSTTLATTAYVKAAIAAGSLPLTGGVLTGTLTAPYLILNAAAGAYRSVQGATAGSQRWSLSLGDAAAESGSNAGSNFAIANYSDAGVNISTPLFISRATSQATFAATIKGTDASMSLGYVTQSGTGAAAGANHFNIDWAGSVAHLWLDATNLGAIAFTSDYRAKQDVAPLPSMWARIKALRPIRYRHRDYSIVAADGVERWGLTAHELQEALTESAATGVKDAPGLIQSPNPWTVIAALTKALQEAMERIEALERKPA